MTKIPVGKIIVEAYRFGITKFPAIVGSIWLAWIVQQAARWLMRAQTNDLSQAILTQDYSLLAGQRGPILAYFIVSTILNVMQIVAVTQLVLHQRHGSPYYYFSLAKPLWRLLGAFVLAILSFIALAIAYGLVIALGAFVMRTTLAAHASARLATMISAILGLAALLVAYGGAIYVVTRLFFLLTPVTIAEQKIDIARAWSLTYGNFWRCFLVMLAFVIPFALADFAVLLLIAGVPPLPHGSSPDQVLLFRQARAAWQLSVLLQSAKFWYVTYPIFGALTALFYGIICSAQVGAYRILSGLVAKV